MTSSPALSQALRTLHINTERTWRGGEKQALSLMNGLRELGHGVELICPPGAPLAERAAACGLTVHEIRMRGELNPVAVARVAQVMRRGFDVCHMHTSHAHTFGVLARGLRRRPITVVSRRVDFSIYRRGTLGLNWIKYRWGVDRYVAISHAIREVLVRDGIASERISVVHSGVDAPAPAERSVESLRRELGIPDAAPVVGNVAHLASHKGQIHLVSAMAELHRQFPELHLVVVGEGEERARLEARVAELQLGGVVHLTGFQRDVSSFLDLFDVFCMPSVQEGLCTSILDAFRWGLPTVASNTGGIPELVRPRATGLLARPGDPADLAAKIGELLRDPALGRQLAERAQRLAVEEFSVEAMVRGNLAVYDKTLSETR
ncbi:MAG: glycosyltransferase [Planctomycetota bacterium]